MKKFSLVLMLSALMMIVLCGCGDDTTKSPSADATQSSTITSGGSVTVGISQDLDSLDPHKAVYAGTKEVLFNIYEGLVKATPEGDLEPAVAESFTVSDDATTYTFKLRKGLTFHDGSEVTAEDVKYSVERYADIQGKDSAFSILKEVKIVDDSTVEINLSEGNSEFLANLTMAILPKSNKQPAKNPIGTGPFMVDTYKAGQSLTCKKFDGYRVEGKPYLDQVVFKVVADNDTAITELQGGNLDILQYLTSDQATTLGDKFNVVEGSVNYVQALFLNNSYEPFKNIKVRQALCYAVDRDAINNFLFEGKSHIIGTNMIPGFSKYYNEETEKVYSVDTEKAKALLKEAGYENGFDLTITVPNNYAPHQTAAEVIVEELKAVGINAKIKMVEFTSWVSECYGKSDFEATVVAVDGTLSPSSWFEKNVSTGKNNFTKYSNKEFDEKFEAAKKSIDDTEKEKLYNEMQMILAKDAASVYLEDPANLIAVNSKLEGYQCYPVAAQDLCNVGYKAE